MKEKIEEAIKEYKKIADNAMNTEEKSIRARLAANGAVVALQKLLVKEE